MRTAAPVKRNISWGPTSRRDDAMPLLPLRTQSPGPVMERGSVRRHASFDSSKQQQQSLLSSLASASSSPSSMSSSRKRRHMSRTTARFYAGVGLVSLLVLGWLYTTSSSTSSWTSSSLLIGNGNKKRKTWPTIQSIPPTAAEIQALNEQLTSAEDILEWAARQSDRGFKTVQLHQFDVTGMLIVQHLVDLDRASQLPVLLVDTLHFFPETYTHIRTVRRQYELSLQIFRPAEPYDTKYKFDQQYGADLHRTDLTQYQLLTYQEPLARGLADVQIYISTDRRETAGPQMPIFELDPAGRLKINPFAGWTTRHAWSYMRQRRTPYNPLYDKGYDVIGDEKLSQKKQLY